jgi:hypothetical protein
MSAVIMIEEWPRLRHRVHRHVVQQRRRGTRVTEGMNAELRQPRPLAAIVVVRSRLRGRPAIRTRLRRRSGVFPEVAGAQTLGHLLGPMFGDQPNHGRAERDHSA